MANFDCVPVVLVTSENISDIWPCIQFCIKNSNFIAVDLELSGLGNRRELNAKSVEDRYKAMMEIAKTRAIISLGLSCFFEAVDTENDTSSKRYQVQTFNLMCLCSEEYTVEPESLNFLVKHGFDFNQQYSSGLPYYRGNDTVTKNGSHLRQLFLELLSGQRPLILHNGFVDLVFLYGNLYCSLPSTLATFLADAQQMFGGGLYDTKYLAEYKERLPASYLEYVFKKSQHTNWKRCTTNRPCVKLAFMSYPPNFPVEFVHCKLRETPENSSLPVCKFFASHGWCSKGVSCDQSHDINDILDAEILRQRKRKKKRGDNDNGHVEQEKSATEDTGVKAVQRNGVVGETKTELALNNQSTGSHRAGFDAFMTGFIFAAHMISVKSLEEELKDLKNKLYLCGKDVPLLVVPSSFSKLSAGHLEKFKRISS